MDARIEIPADVDSFRRAVEADAASSNDAMDAAHAEYHAERLECRADGTSVLVAVARLSAVLGGFPSHIATGVFGSDGTRLRIDRTDGTWRIRGGLMDLIDAVTPVGRPLADRADFGNDVLDAIGVRRTPFAHAMLRGILRWPGDRAAFAADWVRISPLLPRHCIGAMPGMGSDLRSILGRPGDPGASCLWLDVAVETGLTLRERPADGELPPAIAAARDQDAAFLRRLVEHGADPDARVGAVTAIGEAVLSGFSENVRVLVEAGADAGVVSGDGGTLLHAAVENVRRRRNLSSERIVGTLLRAGVPARVRDRRGRTAADLVAEVLGGWREEGRHAADIHDYEEVERILRQAEGRIA